MEITNEQRKQLLEYLSRRPKSNGKQKDTVTPKN
jgi:hypothetical protein